MHIVNQMCVVCVCLCVSEWVLVCWETERWGAYKQNAYLLIANIKLVYVRAHRTETMRARDTRDMVNNVSRFVNCFEICIICN